MTAQASTPWSEWWAMALDALTPPPASTPECKASFPGSRTSSQMVRPLSDPFFFDTGTHISKVSVEAATATATVMAEQVPLKAVQSSRTTIPTTIRSTRWHQILSSFEVYQRFVTENIFFKGQDLRHQRGCGENHQDDLCYRLRWVWVQDLLNWKALLKNEIFGQKSAIV